MSDKIINTFQQRRALDEAVTHLADTENELSITQAVRDIVHEYPHDLVQTTLLKHIDTNSGQLRGALGHLARLLPPESIVPALRGIAGNRSHSSRIRLNAATILEQFLGESVPAGMLADLTDAAEVAFDSLREALDVAKRNRHVLLEYAMQMRQEDIAVAYTVLDLLHRVPPLEQIELLRIIVQDTRPRVAATALDRLIGLDATETGPKLTRALHILQQTLPPDLAAKAERAARKLQMRGIRYTLPAPDGWRALCSPADVSGNYLLWFVKSPGGGKGKGAKGNGVLFTLAVNRKSGVLQAACHESVCAADLPQPSAVGELLTVPAANGQSIVLLEIPFDVGRWLLQQMLVRHWEGSAAQSLFGEYTLYNDLLWQFVQPARPDALASLLDSAATASKVVNGVREEMLNDTTEEATEKLLGHPAMEGWLAHFRALLGRTPYFSSLCRQILAEHPEISDAAGVLIRELLRLPDGQTFLRGLEAGLQSQAAFLHLLNGPSTQEAMTAVALAQTLSPSGQEALPPDKNPLLHQLFGIGLQTVVS